MKNPFNSGKNDEKINEEINENTEVAVDEQPEITEQEAVEDTKEDEKEEKNPLQEKYETLNNQYIRLAADFDNYRKRQEQEKEALLRLKSKHGDVRIFVVDGCMVANEIK